MSEFNQGSFRITFKIDGMEKVRKNLQVYSQKQMQVFLDMVNKAALTTETMAKTKAPVNMGRLRSSIHLRFQSKAPPLIAASVGAGVDYAAFMELGTARMGLKTARAAGVPIPSSYIHGQKHNVPAKYLLGWAKTRFRGAAGKAGFKGAGFGTKQKTSPAQQLANSVSFYIRRNKGLRARPYLWPAFSFARKRFERSILQSVDLAAKWARLKKGQP